MDGRSDNQADPQNILDFDQKLLDINYGRSVGRYDQCGDEKNGWGMERGIDYFRTIKIKNC